MSKIQVIVPESLITKITELVNSIDYDECGYMGKGGNGGLISEKTLKLMGKTRLELSKVKT